MSRSMYRNLGAKVVCSAQSGRRTHRRTVSHRQQGLKGWAWFAGYTGTLAVARREMVSALRQLMQAPDWPAACGMLVRYPFLLVESAPELLHDALHDAEVRGDQENAAMLQEYLEMLELARRQGVVAVIRWFRRNQR